MNRLLIGGAVIFGLLLAFVDSRPTWDDTGVMAGTILLACGVLGAVRPQRPWLWALAIGVWIPLVEIATMGSYAALAALVVAFAGAYLGMGLRRLATLT